MIARVMIVLVLFTVSATSHALAVKPPVAESPAVMSPVIVRGPTVALDGNTLLKDGQRVRLFGIAAPEMTAPLGPWARAALDALIDGHPMTCHVVDQDRYKRPVAICLRDVDQLDVGQAMIARGWARPHRLDTHGDTLPGTIGSMLAIDYNIAEYEAREAGLGIWAKPNEKAAWQDWVPVGSLFLAAITGFGGFYVATRWRIKTDREAEQRAAAYRTAVLARTMAFEMRQLQAALESRMEAVESLLAIELDSELRRSVWDNVPLLSLRHTAVYNANLSDLGLLGQYAESLISLERLLLDVRLACDMLANESPEPDPRKQLVHIRKTYLGIGEVLPRLIEGLTDLAESDGRQVET